MQVLVCFLRAFQRVGGRQRAAGQTESDSTSASRGQDPDSITTFIRRVRLPITVVDKKGQFVSGLNQSDFLVLEDKLPQQIETFSDDLGRGLTTLRGGVDGHFPFDCRQTEV